MYFHLCLLRKRLLIKLHICFVMLGLLPMAHCQSSPSDSTNTASKATRPVDPLQDEGWCSLPKSDKREFYKREILGSTSLNIESHRSRDRDAQTFTKLGGLLQTMGSNSVADANVTGNLLFYSPRGNPNPVPITIKIRPNGSERAEVKFPSATNLFISDGKNSRMFIGEHQHVLAPVTVAAHEISVLPQWSIVRHSPDESFGLKSFGQHDGLWTVEVFPPERANAQEELLMPRLPTCVAIDESTNQIVRIEKLVRSETHLTRAHRETYLYSDYRVMNNVWVPYTQTRYIDGELYVTLKIDSVSFNNHFADGEFSWSK